MSKVKIHELPSNLQSKIQTNKTRSLAPPRIVESPITPDSSGSNFRHPPPYRVAQSRPASCNEPSSNHRQHRYYPSFFPSSNLKSHICLHIRLTVAQARSATCQCRADILLPGQLSTRLCLWNHLEFPPCLDSNGNLGN
jgi:hypothetical protein